MPAHTVPDEDGGAWSEAAPSIGMAALVVILLAFDELNPVKVFCGYALYYERLTGIHITEARVACFAWFLLVALTVSERRRLLYYSLRTFFRCTLNNIFFRSVEVVGMEHLPKDGPVILTGNHNNQFVDGIILLTNCTRQISFMIARKSWDRPLIGFLAKAFHCIPVARPQDLATRGAGTLTLDGSGRAIGQGTRFTDQVKAGSLLEVKGISKSLKVRAVISDTELLLEGEGSDEALESEASYKVMPKIDQSVMYSAVYTSLKKGRCLGIFPEGGSHDRTDLLPLKAGVAVIALDAYSKHHMTVPIVPVGLNYFSGHRFGGRVVVEYGPPIVVPEQIYLQHETDRRGATEALLQLIATGMRSVIVPTPDYHTLQQIYMARRLYVPDGLKLSAEQTMDLNRRFAVGIQRILKARSEFERSTSGALPSAAMSATGSMSPTASNGGGGSLSRLSSSGSLGSLSSSGAPPSPGSPRSSQPINFSVEELRFIDEFKTDVEEYMSTLKRLGLRDHQVRQIGWWGIADLVGRLVYLLMTMCFAAIPQLMFNLPTAVIASRFAASEQTKSLKASTVKLAARDVLMSYKIIYVLIVVPCLYVFYGSLILIFCDWCPTTIVIVFALCPLSAFCAMKASEQGFRAYADIVPLFKRFLPGTRAEQDTLPARRAALQKKLNQAVKRFGPQLGDLYQLKSVDWAKEMGWFTYAAAASAAEGGSGAREAAAAAAAAAAEVPSAVASADNSPSGGAAQEGAKEGFGTEGEGEGLTKRLLAGRSEAE